MTTYSSSHNLSRTTFDPIAIGNGSSYWQNGSTGNGDSTQNAGGSSSGPTIGASIGLGL